MSGATELSLSQKLCTDSVDDVVEKLGLDEVAGDEPEAFMVLRSPMMDDPVGAVRVFGADAKPTLIYVGMTVPPIGLDSHMMFAFTPSGSAVPHFTVDSVENAGDFAFHLDMIPRLDLGAHLDYMDYCFTPVTEARAAALTLEGLTPANLEPRQWALMSEWMLANRADESSFREITKTVDAYRTHWYKLWESPPSGEMLRGADADALAARDEANREAIFNPDVDKVWGNVERLLGAQRSEEVRTLLAGAGEKVLSR